MDSHKKNLKVESIILAGGSGVRLDMGPKAFVKLGELTLLDMAISTMLEITNKATVALPPEYLRTENRWVNDSRVTCIAGGKRRVDTLRLLVNSTEADWIVLHDVVHPFVTARTAQEVLNEAYKRGCAAAATQLQEFVYNQAGKQIAQPGHAYLVQKPIVFRNSAIKVGFAKADDIGFSDDASALEILALAGVIPSFVPGAPLSQKITTAADLQFAEKILLKGSSLSSNGATENLL